MKESINLELECYTVFPSSFSLATTEDELVTLICYKISTRLAVGSK